MSLNEMIWGVLSGERNMNEQDPIFQAWLKSTFEQWQIDVDAATLTLRDDLEVIRDEEQATKAIVDAATVDANPHTLVLRDSGGYVQLRYTPTAGNDATNKSYVDQEVNKVNQALQDDYGYLLKVLQDNGLTLPHMVVLHGPSRGQIMCEVPNENITDGNSFWNYLFSNGYTSKDTALPCFGIMNGQHCNQMFATNDNSQKRLYYFRDGTQIDYWQTSSINVFETNLHFATKKYYVAEYGPNSILTCLSQINRNEFYLTADSTVNFDPTMTVTIEREDGTRLSDFAGTYMSPDNVPMVINTDGSLHWSVGWTLNGRTHVKFTKVV